jgi:FkbM family methyltransferase
MGILNKLGGRHRLLANPVTRNLARAAVRMNIGNLGSVSESFRGTFQVSGYGVSGRYELGPRDTVGEVLYWYGLKRFEPSTVPLFIELARKSRGVLDIGANTGLYAVLACAANPAARVFAWEPVPYLAQKLRNNISLNGFEGRCEVRQAAVGRCNQEVEFYISDDTTMSSLSTPYAAAKGHTATKTHVQMESVDTLVPADCAIDLIKIDVEGHEFEALSGAAETLRRWQPKIVFECLPETDPEPIESLLRGVGYSISALSSHRQPKKIEKITPGISENHNFLASV